MVSNNEIVVSLYRNQLVIMAYEFASVNLRKFHAPSPPSVAHELLILHTVYYENDLSVALQCF